MKLLKPTWVSHDGNPIFSVDLHPDGSRFATGGQGDGGSSGKIIVWNTSPVVNAKDEHDENVPKVLCVMDNHLACVNCVRWSCNGRYLASGGDDRIIMIWQFAGYGGPIMFGSSENQSSGLKGERWRVVHTLKRHTGDILHLAWSPTDQWLASCSIDNTVVVWNALKFPEITTVLRGHTSLVKGVTWDPVGTYLASQSADKSVKIWKTLDWKLEHTVTKPFVECGETTHVLRLDWSPDGGYLVSAHAMNNAGPTAQIIERSGWKTNMDFVGHRKAITCTRFNGCMFRRHPDKAAGEPRLPYTCCAIGSRDRSLSVWLTSLQRPLIVVNDLFNDSVMDVTWSFDGNSLLCCSWDGSVAYLQFKPQEIGEALTREEMNNLHKKTYGKSMSIMSQPLVIENPAMLALQQQKKAEDDAAFKKPQQDPKTPTKYPTKQVEVRTQAGKRRITPVFVAPQEDLGGIPRPFGSAFGSSTNLSSNLSKSPLKHSRTTTPEKRRSDSEKSSPGMQQTTPGKSSSSQSDHVIKVGSASKEKQKDNDNTPSHVNGEVKTLPFKKDKEILIDKSIQLVEQKKVVLDHRITEKTKPSIPQSAAEPSDKLSAQKIPVKSKSDKKLTEKNATTNKDVNDSVTSVIAAVSTQQKKVGRPPGLNMKRKANDSTPIPHASPKQPKRVKKDNIVTPSQSRNQTPAQQSLMSRLLPLPPVQMPVSVDKLTPKKVVKTLSIKISNADETFELKLHNDSLAMQQSQKNSFAMHKIVCTKGSTAEWESVISAPGVVMDGNRNIVCIACKDQTVRLLSMLSGRQLLPTVCVKGKPYSVTCNGWNVMIVCCDASVSVWDTKCESCLISNQSFAHLLPNTGDAEETNTDLFDEVVHTNDQQRKKDEKNPLHECELTDSGLPLLTFSNRKSYTFSRNMLSWILVNSIDESIEHCADYKSDTSSLKGGILDSLQKKATGVGACALRMFHSNTNLQRCATAVFLESRVETCIALNSVEEYSHWMLSYIRYLVNEGLDVRLREICDDMLGPTHLKSNEIMESPTTSSSTWKPFVLGLFKRTLLRDEILPIIGSNLNFQRLYTEYQDQLDVCNAPGSILLG
ncbi:protein HIRA-like isoform X1 [Styela clava]